MRIENSYEQSLSVTRSLNTSLTQAQGAQFAMLLSFMTEPMYAREQPAAYPAAAQASPQPAWEPDEAAQQLALELNGSMGAALQQGQVGHFLLTRSLTEEFPNTQEVTAVRRQAVAAYQAQLSGAPTAESVIEQINHGQPA